MAAAIVSTKQIPPATGSNQQGQKVISSNYAQQLVAQENITSSNNTNLNGLRASKMSENNNNSHHGASSSPHYKVGDIVWAKVNNHPWWPCYVSKDLNGSYFHFEGSY